ncbi:MAG: glycine cleavage system aminomethyltransferase GcvT [Halobacteria archaeon]
MAERRPPLHQVHEEMGGNFTDFGGWSMPVEYTSIQDEHHAVRDDVGVFDVSHMGQVLVHGEDSRELMQKLTTNDVDELGVGDAQYSCITNEDGVLIDDTVVYRIGDDEYLFIPNAGSDELMRDRLLRHRDEWSLDAEVENRTEQYAMLAVQGPRSVNALDGVAEGDPGRIDPFGWRPIDVAGVGCIVARTGYTGEDGFELIFEAGSGEAEEIWSQLVEAEDVKPCGLGSRDTLRMEMGFLLSGQDFDPEENPRTPIEAGLGFVVDTDTGFVGSEAIEEDEPEESITGFKLTERGVPRHGYVIEKDGERVGEVTSGTMSPTLEEPIGIGYVPVDIAEPGVEIEVVVRHKPKNAKIATTPFLDKQ